MKTLYVKIGGITCDHCRLKIKSCLLNVKNVKEVSVNGNIAYISYDGDLDKKEIIKKTSDLDYITNESYISDELKTIKEGVNLKEFIIILFIILFIGILVNKIFGFNVFNVIVTSLMECFLW